MGHKSHPDRTAALARWRRAFGVPAPAYLSVRLMEKAAAHETQCKALGGLSAGIHSVLRQALKGKAAVARQTQTLNAGAHLVREWNGRTYKVTVTSHGFELEGRQFKSLSAIARQITGTAWSGPRFFDLKKAKGKAA